MSLSQINTSRLYYLRIVLSSNFYLSFARIVDYLQNSVFGNNIFRHYFLRAYFFLKFPVFLIFTNPNKFLVDKPQKMWYNKLVTFIIRYKCSSLNFSPSSGRKKRQTLFKRNGSAFRPSGVKRLQFLKGRKKYDNYC